MYCPRCGQQQFPDQVRFCSRCGLHLIAVSQLLMNEGMTFNQPHYQKERLPLIKRQEIRKGAKLTFLSLFTVIPSFILASVIEHGFPLVIPFIAFLVGLAQMMYYFLFGESILRIKNQSPEFNANQHQFNYHPAQALPFEPTSFSTAEFVQPQSITVPTSNLIKNK